MRVSFRDFLPFSWYNSVAIFSHSVKVEVVHQWSCHGGIFFRYSTMLLYSSSTDGLQFYFCSTSLSSGVPSSLVELFLIVSRDTPTPFCLVFRIQIRLALSLAFLVVRIVRIFLSSWRFLSWDASFALSSR